MFQEAEASSSSVIEQLVEKSNEFVEDNCELGDKLESAGMVFVQSLKELGRTSEILKQLKVLFGSVTTIPAQVFLTGIVKRKASSTKKALVDFWQLAFSYQEVTLEGTSIHDIVHQNSTCGAAENVGTAAKPNGIMHEPPSNMGLRQTIDGRTIKKEPVYGGNSPFAFGPHGSYMESRSAMGDASVSSFRSVESNRQPLNEPLLDADTTSFGFLGEMPQNFGFSDLTADFTNSSDILESYSRTPFLATDTGSLLDSNEGIERLTNASENLRYTNSSGD
ncbi:hypothetical protein BC332_34156 [Capsicum chinense]|nr:hypothetical protein BC332_34156 [Capsicum chinense]